MSKDIEQHEKDLAERELAIREAELEIQEAQIEFQQQLFDLFDELLSDALNKEKKDEEVDTNEMEDKDE